MPKFQPIPNFDSLSPQTTKGDLISRSTTAAVRVATGSDGQVLTADSTQASGIKWAAAASGSAFNVVSKTTTYTAIANDYILASSASFTITLPTAVGISGQSIAIQHAGTSLSQVYTKATTSAQTIGGVASGSYALYTNGETLVLVSDGANWQIVNHQTNTGWLNLGNISISATAAFVFTWTGSQNVVIGDTYTDGSGHLFIVAASTNTTTGTFSGPTNPAGTGILTRQSGTGVASVAWTSVTTTGQPVKSSTKTLDSILLKRTGNYARVWLQYSQSGTTSAVSGSGDYIYYLPVGLQIDSTNLTPFQTAGSISALAMATATVPTNGQMWTAQPLAALVNFAVVYSTSSLGSAVRLDISSSFSSMQYQSGAAAALATAATAFNIYFDIPIAGWQP